MYVVDKLGGDTMASPEYIRRAVGVVGRQVREGQKPLIVVSAVSGVTNKLIGDFVYRDSSVPANRGYFDEQHVPDTEQLMRRRHYGLIEGLIHNRELRKLAKQDVDAVIGRLVQDLRSPASSRDTILSYGEMLSAPILMAALEEGGLRVHLVNPAETSVVIDGLRATIDFDATERELERHRRLLDQGVVVLEHGYFGRDGEGNTRTLKRGGSDSKAVAIGIVLPDSQVYLWKNTEGVMSADPKIVPNARHVSALCYAEAVEAGKVVQPESISLASDFGKALSVRSLRHPRKSTAINSEGDPSQEVKIISLSDGEWLFDIVSPSLAYAAAFPYEAFSKRGINISVIDSDMRGRAFVTCRLDEQRADAIKAAQLEMEQLGYQAGIEKTNIIYVIGHHVSPETVGKINGIIGEHALIGSRPRWMNVYSATSILPDKLDPKLFVRQLHEELIG